MQVSDDTPVGPRQLDTEEMRQKNGGWSWVAKTAQRMTQLVMAPYRALAIGPDEGARIAAALRKHLDETFPTGRPWHVGYEKGLLSVAWGPFSALAAGLRREADEAMGRQYDQAQPLPPNYKGLRLVEPFH